MIRAVLDTNTVVSGIGWGGPPAAVLDAALAGHFEIVTSPALLDELIELLALTAMPSLPRNRRYILLPRRSRGERRLHRHRQHGSAEAGLVLRRGVNLEDGTWMCG